MFHRLIISLFAVMLFVCGCSENKAPDPPIARAELTARLYDTLKVKRYSEALAITDKLLALDPNDPDLMEMRDRLIGNIAAVKVQEYIDNKQLEGALKYLRKERKRYPVMPKLRILEEEVRNLIALRNAAKVLAEADTIPKLAAALDFIVPLAAKYPATEQLHKDIKQRKNDLEKMRDAAALQVEKAAGKPLPAAKKP